MHTLEDNSNTAFVRSTRVLLIAAVSFLACALAHALAGETIFQLLLWPASAIALAFGWRYGRTWMLPAAVAAAVWSYVHTQSILLGVATLASTVIGPLLTLELMRRLARWKPADFRIDALVRFVISALLVCAPVNAAIITTALYASAFPSPGSPVQIALIWWLLESLGLLLITPALLALLRSTNGTAPLRPAPFPGPSSGLGTALSMPFDVPTLAASVAIALFSLTLARAGFSTYSGLSLFLFVPVIGLGAIRQNERVLALTLSISSLPLLAVRTSEAAITLNPLAPVEASTLILSTSIVALLMQAIGADRLQALSNIAEQVRQDLTTGLLNDRGLLTELGERLAHPERPHYGLIGIHVTNFDTIHDLCGPIQALSLEQSVASLLGSQAQGAIAARLSSGRFALIASCNTAGQVRSLARDLYTRLNSQVFRAEHGSLRLQACIGGLLIDRQVFITAEDILLSLSDAMAIAASAQEPKLFVEPLSQAMIDARRSHQGKIEHLRTAIKDRHLEVYAQQILDPLAPPASLSYEILTRMRDRDGALIRPPEFLPLAVQAQMTVALDRSVIQKVFTWLATNQDALARTHKCSINLSGMTMSDAMIASFIREQRALCAIPADKIVFEITESEAIRNPVAASRLVDELKADGFGIALDDFGTGLATFEYLKRFQLDYLKIDGAFIRNVVNDPIDQEIVLSTVRVAQHLNVRIVAEHVHSRDIYEHLKSLGVDHVQGDLIGIAMPIETLFARSIQHGLISQGHGSEPGQPRAAA